MTGVTRAALVAVLLAGACKSQRQVTSTTQNMGPILQKFAGNYQMEKDENGMMKVKSDRRSSFEAKTFASGNKPAVPDKEFATKGYATKEVDRKDFAGTKTYATKAAREAGGKSRWQMPWTGRKDAREAGRDYDTGSGYPTAQAPDDGRGYATRAELRVEARRNYPDKALENVRSPMAGEGGGPNIRDVRSLLGKDG